MERVRWTDFDDIVRLLRVRIATLEQRIADLAASVAHMTDKELGLALDTLPKEERAYLFIHRKFGAVVGKARDALMRAIRPTGNDLSCYTPSYAMGRMMEDAAS